ncbi:MAG: fasciclin domain-containing protein [Fimbriimonadaceae bacterium]
MKLHKVVAALAFGAALSTFAVAKAPAKDIVDTAVGAGQFTTLTKLVTSAGLVDVLRGNGPFTVLAPNDEAFKKVPQRVLDLLASDRELLKQVLTYHVIAGSVKSTDLKNGTSAKTVQGDSVLVHVLRDGVFFNTAKVVAADIAASNGVIHVIDTVILPPTIARKVAQLEAESLVTETTKSGSCSACTAKP